MNSDNDRVNCSTKNDVGQVDLHHISNAYDLEDIWCRWYPNKREFTWSGRNRMSRIDFWLSSLSLDNQISEVYHCYAPYTDHKSIDIVVRINDIAQGSGIWKMNTSNLLKEEFRENFAQMWAKWQTQKCKYSDIKVWWDVGKRQIKTLMQNFSKKEHFERNMKLKDLETAIEYMQKHDTGKDEEIRILQKEYESIHSKSIEGVKIRSRIKWWEEGEKSSKFFHSIEKRNGKNKTWDKILDQDDNYVFSTEKIQKIQVDFYQDLYRSQNLENPDNSYFLDDINRQLCESSKNLMDSVLEKDEISKAVKKMSNNKSPGEDGIPVEFYKLFGILYQTIC